jgi:porphobilinogen synthase
MSDTQPLQKMSESTRPLPLGAVRMRRLRRTETLRSMVRETILVPSRLVLPLFLEEGTGRTTTPIESMPGVSRLTVEAACSKVGEAMELGVSSFALFPRIPDARKTPDAREAWDNKNLACKALKTLRDKFPEACLIADVALDPYSSQGHDGLVGAGPHGRPEVLNDKTVTALCKQAIVQADAGADVIAPSDMMDGRVGAIRLALDSTGFEHVVILSYTAKYASAFYGPFRDALDSAPVKDPNVPGDKHGYQLDPANIRQALREATLDIQEGADILMVKPAIHYLDVIRELRAHCDLPIAAYHVSGEYAMLRAAAERGWLDYEKCLNEALVAIARAGADIILTYGALDFAKQCHRGAGHG